VELSRKGIHHETHERHEMGFTAENSKSAERLVGGAQAEVRRKGQDCWMREVPEGSRATAKGRAPAGGAWQVVGDGRSVPECSVGDIGGVALELVV
jgi:hypothetical protein